MINTKLEDYLKENRYNVTSHNVLESIINKIENFYEIQPATKQVPGKQHSLLRTILKG